MDRKKYPLMFHILELRRRLLKIAVIFFVVSILGYFKAEFFLSILIHPLTSLGVNKRLIFTELTEVFSTYVKLGLTLGTLTSLPFLFNELWKFLLPGLKKKEQKQLRPIFVISPLLFIGGLTFSYFFVLPNAVYFFGSFESLIGSAHKEIPLVLEARISDYFSLSTQILCAFGIAFQLPVIMYIANLIGFLTYQNMQEFRRIAIIVILVISAILTPPDVLSMFALAIPLYGLYEGTILFLKTRTRKRAQNA